MCDLELSRIANKILLVVNPFFLFFRILMAYLFKERPQFANEQCSWQTNERTDGHVTTQNFQLFLQFSAMDASRAGVWPAGTALNIKIFSESIFY